MSMYGHYYALAAFFGFFAVALGAFGAHGLKEKVSTDMLQIFETAVRYQMYHALALFAIPWVLERFSSPLLARVSLFWIAGIIIFSGSLYLLVLTGVKKWGAVTPIGGLLFLIGWLFLFLGIVNQK